MGKAVRRGVFISYRRKGSAAGFAVLLHNQLRRVLGRDRVFLDVGENAIRLGQSWKDRVREAVTHCDVVLALIDEQWAHKLKNEDDPVRFELETAVTAKKSVVPVMVAGSAIPDVDQFPQSLASMRDAQAHEIRPSTPEADTRSLVRALTGKDPWVRLALDGWDLTCVGSLVTLGFLLWLSWGKNALNVTELWLWGSALLLFGVLCLAGRRALFGFPGQVYRVEWVPVRKVLAVMIPLAGAWTYAASYVYRTPTFKQGGILIARLGNDPSDRYRGDLADSIRVEITRLVRNQLGDPKELVQELPRRANDDASARNLGQRARATVVLWGDVKPDHVSQALINARVTFLGTALFNTPDVPIERRVGLTSDTGRVGLKSDVPSTKLTTGLHLLQRVIPLLLAGYQYYGSAKDSSGYRRAYQYFDGGLHLLENQHIATEDSSTHDPLTAALVSLHFYVGNSLVALGEQDSAKLSYRAAIDHSHHPVEGQPLYLEPVNNLGRLLIEEGKPTEASQLLERADRECSEQKAELVCAYVWYNLGDALLDRSLYEQACPRFARAAGRVEQVNSARTVDVVDQQLLGFTYQELAYCLVKLAGSATGQAQRDSLLRRAEKAWRAGVATLSRDSRLHVPARFQLTLARIHIAQGEWNRAIDVLSKARHEGVHEPNLYLLMAIADWCAGDYDASQQESRSFLDKTRTLPAQQNQGLDDLQKGMDGCMQLDSEQRGAHERSSP